MQEIKKDEILDRVRIALAEVYGCRPGDFMRDGVTFACCEEKKGRQTPFLEAVTMGRGVVVSAAAGIMPRVKDLLAGRSREEIFEFPFLYGQTIAYIPDPSAVAVKPPPEEFSLHLLQGEEVSALGDIKGFENAFILGEQSTRIVLYAMRGNEIAALAGASEEYDGMWELGIDVREPYRRGGLGSLLVGNLTAAIMEKGIIPFYCAASSNIASQAVAHRCGFIPCWVSTYRNILDGSGPYPNIVEHLKL